MATYTPKELAIPAAITASYVTKYTATATTGIMRTFVFVVLTTAHSVFLTREAGAEATAILSSYLLTANIPSIFNGWYVIPSSGIVQVKADSIATNAPNFTASGYEYV